MLEEKKEAHDQIAWKKLQEEIEQHGFQAITSGLALDVIEKGIHIYSIDKVNVKYNKRSHASHSSVTPERIQKLESIIFKYCGWGAKGSTHLFEQIKKWKERHLQTAR